MWARLFDRPTPLEGEAGIRNWLAMLGSATGARFSVADVDEIQRRLCPHLWDSERCVADYRLPPITSDSGWPWGVANRTL